MKNDILISMKTRTLKQILLYNYRYWFGYSIIAFFGAYFLLWQINTIPPGLSQLELQAASSHTSLNGILSNPIYPLHSTLQYLITSIFGASSITIRIPSILIAALSAYFIYSLMKKWFGKATALLTTSILVSSDWFLYIARHGTGAIEFSLWLAVALSCLTKLLEHKSKWLIVLSIALSGLLFAPLGIFIAGAIGITLFSVRVFRSRANEAALWVKIFSVLIIILALSAAGFTSYHDSSFAKELIGVVNIPSIVDFPKNIFVNAAAIVAILPGANPEISPTGVLVVRFFELIFILFGIALMFKTRVNRLNLSVIIISIILVLVGGLLPNGWGFALLIVPAAIFMTAGMRHLMHRWRQTFPKNPYARIIAYLPLSVLFILITLLHYNTYFELWPSQTSTHTVFLPDYALLNNELRNSSSSENKCLVISENKALKQLIFAQHTICKPVFERGNSSLSSFDKIIVQSGDSSNFIESNKLTKNRALVSNTKEDNVRWLIVKP